MTALSLPILRNQGDYYGNKPLLIVTGSEVVTPNDIAADLAPHSPEYCAARGIRHSSEDDHSTAIFPGDNQHVKRMELCYSVNKAFRKHP